MLLERSGRALHDFDVSRLALDALQSERQGERFAEAETRRKELPSIFMADKRRHHVGRKLDTGERDPLEHELSNARRCIDTGRDLDGNPTGQKLKHQGVGKLPSKFVKVERSTDDGKAFFELHPRALDPFRKLIHGPLADVRVGFVFWDVELFGRVGAFLVSRDQLVELGFEAIASVGSREGEPENNAEDYTMFHGPIVLQPRRAGN